MPSLGQVIKPRIYSNKAGKFWICDRQLGGIYWTAYRMVEGQEPQKVAWETSYKKLKDVLDNHPL